MSLIGSTVFGITGASVIAISAYLFRKRAIIKDTPTSKIRSMAKGLVEVQGNIISENYLQAPFSKTPCVAYEVIYERCQRESSVITKTRRSSKGWRKIKTEREEGEFYISDGTGKTMVKPKRSDFNLNPNKKFYAKAGWFSGITSMWNQISSKEGTIFGVPLENFQEIDVNQNKIGWSRRVGDIRVTEKLLKKGSEIYVLGSAQSDQDSETGAAIKYNKNNKIFMVYEGDIDDVLKKMLVKPLLALGIGLACIAASVYVFFQ